MVWIVIISPDLEIMWMPFLLEITTSFTNTSQMMEVFFCIVLFGFFFGPKIEDKEVPGLYTLPSTRSTKFVPEKWWLVEMIHFILKLSVFWGHVTFHGGGISLCWIFSTQKMMARGKWRLIRWGFVDKCFKSCWWLESWGGGGRSKK